MKVLVTGCSSAQTSESTAEKTPTFAGLIVQGLKEAGHTVVWEKPTMRWDEAHLEQYDSVVVGLSAPTSITSHRLYGALSVIDKAKNVSNVKYLVDAPEPHKLWNGIRAIAQNPDNLVKDFYSRRAEYSFAKEPKELERLQSVISYLYTNSWNDTLFPALPWSEEAFLCNHIPNLSVDRALDISVDSLIFSNIKDTGLYIKSDSDSWFADARSPWVSKISETLSMNVVSYGTTGASNVMASLNRSIGSLISVYKNNEPWWSPSLPMSLHVNTPVVTDWRYSSEIGSSWATLAHAIEDLEPRQRSILAMTQKDAYIQAIPEYEDTLDMISSAVFGQH